MNSRIRFGEPIEPEAPVEELPPNSLILSDRGSRRQAQFQIYIVEEVYQKIWNHILQTPNIESGGVLVGHPFKTFDGKITFVIVTAAIPQHSDNRSIGHFTVGPHEIAQARTELEVNYPGLVAVGWYHSHPGHGVFLSGQDMTIVRSIYNTSWNIALVIDPKRNKEGIFVGAQGQQVGGERYDQLYHSWISLNDIPDSIKAIGLYNQWKENRDVLNELQDFVKNSPQLKHWHTRGYRDITNSPGQVEPNLPPSDLQPLPIHTTSPHHSPPEPARSLANPGKEWLLLGLGLLTLLVLFFCIAAVSMTYGEGGLGILRTLLPATNPPIQPTMSVPLPTNTFAPILPTSTPTVVPAATESPTLLPPATNTPIPPSSTPAPTDTTLPPTSTPVIETMTPAAEGAPNSDLDGGSTLQSPITTSNSPAPIPGNDNVVTDTTIITQSVPITR